MGFGEHELVAVGSARHEVHRSSEKADSAFQPQARMGVKSWPTLVIESRLSESLARLRVDARWWIDNSEGKAKIVVAIPIQPQKKLYLERWERVPVNNHFVTQAHPQGSNFPQYRWPL